MTSSYLHQGPLSPAQKAAAITKSDTLDIVGNPTRALFVGGTGDLKLLLAGDADPIVFKGVPAGTVLPFGVQRIYSTDTTATDFVALW